MDIVEVSGSAGGSNSVGGASNMGGSSRGSGWTSLDEWVLAEPFINEEGEEVAQPNPQNAPANPVASQGAAQEAQPQAESPSTSSKWSGCWIDQWLNQENASSAPGQPEDEVNQPIQTQPPAAGPSKPSPAPVDPSFDQQEQPGAPEAMLQAPAQDADLIKTSIIQRMGELYPTDPWDPGNSLIRERLFPGWKLRKLATMQCPTFTFPYLQETKTPPFLSLLK